MIQNLNKLVIESGGSIHPLIISSVETNGYGLCNPSIINIDGKILINIRNVHYTLHYNEFHKKFQSAWSGPLQYLNPESEPKLITTNFLSELDLQTFELKNVFKIDTKKLDVSPQWTFVGLEDVRLVKWDDKLYACGVRRDTTTNGQGRMELSEIVDNKEVNRYRIELPIESDDNYCEKNWMPIVDMPFHFVKWSNPLEIVKIDLKNNTSEFVIKKIESNLTHVNERGGSQVISFDGYNVCLTHEVFFPYNPQQNKDAIYKHKFLVWDKDWNLISVSQEFNFMSGLIEFACGMTVYDKEILVTFGFQDNAAYLLKIPIDFFRKLIRIDTKFDNFDWSILNNNIWFKNVLETEIILGNIYEKFNKVDKNDVVVDIGSSTGIFSYDILNRLPNKIYCIEPHNELFISLQKNFKNMNNVICINKAISDVDGNIKIQELYNSNISEQHEEEYIDVVGIKFKTFIDTYSISKIDFLKIDCEGAEYDIFNSENKDWILSNVKKIAGEFHLNNVYNKQRFREFRDNFLKDISNYKIFSIDGVDIKWNLFDDHFIEYYSCIMIYIDNSNEDWRMKYPTLEITTSIPIAGCAVNCEVCPQKTLIKSYTGDRSMSLQNFKSIIDKIPKEVRIIFSGFTEPWLNKDCTSMVEYAHFKGHSISIFTTGIGMTIDDIDRIKNIPFDVGPNGGFCLHVPDKKNISKHPITHNYIKVLEYFKKLEYVIKGFNVVSMAPVHSKVNHIFPNSKIIEIWSRAGNIENNTYDIIKSTQQKSYPTTCGCLESVYHNVILPNGDISLCCMDYGLNHILGNIYNQNYNDIMVAQNTCFKLCQSCENGVSI